MAPIVKIYPDVHTWVEEAALEITRVVKESVALKGLAFVALSGGRTPVAVYQRLTQLPWREIIPWSKIHWFWIDERWVPPDHSDSNYGSAWKAMLSKVPVDESKIHRIPTEGMDPPEAAAVYEEQLRNLLRPQGAGLDLAVLGMGTDGHTASLFPGSPLLTEPTHWFAASLAPVGVRQRITMLLPLLNASDTLLFLVAGADKKAVIDAVLHGGALAQNYPAGKVRAARQTIWILDSEAAGVVPPEALRTQE
jgi:6-phosphogluconolactonase